MEKHRDEYLKARETFIQFVQDLIDRRGDYDKKLDKQESKKSIFRLNRDVRFSKNKSPYKTWMWGVIAVEWGKKSRKAGYYIHIQPWDRSGVAGGIRMPDGPLIKALRKAIAKDYKKMKRILWGDFKKYFGELMWEKLKTRPKWYELDHPAIELLRHKSFHCWHHFKDSELLKKWFFEEIIEWFKKIQKLNKFLNDILDEAVKSWELDEWLVKTERL